ncbi:hypothetical protein Anas_13337 [Armadillidium nasatum]|uniref:C-type lectin domain-containing protein n=1 Tax=Armadillidium nasatum TaxID=96803 RepID=A0A5N5SSE5_9CRUS|nr:hypothetical protein Anas_13337 [Armadillidium nasatum]
MFHILMFLLFGIFSETMGCKLPHHRPGGGTGTRAGTGTGAEAGTGTGSEAGTGTGAETGRDTGTGEDNMEFCRQNKMSRMGSNNAFELKILKICVTRTNLNYEDAKKECSKSGFNYFVPDSDEMHTLFKEQIAHVKAQSPAHKMAWYPRYFDEVKKKFIWESKAENSIALPGFYDPSTSSLNENKICSVWKGSNSKVEPSSCQSHRKTFAVCAQRLF